MLDHIYVAIHVVLSVHDVGDHVISGLRLGKGTCEVVRQAPHFIFIIICPFFVNWTIIVGVVAIIAATLIGPDLVAG